MRKQRYRRGRPIHRRGVACAGTQKRGLYRFL